MSTQNEKLIAEAQVWDRFYRDQVIAVAPNSQVGVMLRLADALEAAEARLEAMPDLVVAELSGVTGYWVKGGDMRYSPDGVHAAAWNAVQAGNSA